MTRLSIVRPKPRAPQSWCSFCGKERDDVRRLLAGPGVQICDECVSLCISIIAELDAKEGVGGLKECATP